MTSPKTPEQLAEAIENLVAGYVEEARQMAQVALGQSFARHAAPAGRMKKKQRSRGQATSPTVARRSADELSAVREQLYELICAHSGESMTLFSEQLGISVKDLHRPMSKLKAEGRIRSVGERNQTRYFPAVGRRPRSVDA
ncbi:MAG: hypothetical protein AAF449_01335 [Myxococcota bacterium]